MKMDKTGKNQEITHRARTTARTSSKEHPVKDTVDISGRRQVPDEKMIMKALSSSEIRGDNEPVH